MQTSLAENTASGHASSQLKDWLLALVSAFERALGSIPVWWSICLGSAAILAVSARHSMNSDGLSYLELAYEGLRSGPSGLLNGYWSPGYPALLSLALALFRPSPAQEFPLVHFVNFFIFGLTLLAFHFFLRQWLLSHTDDAIGDKEKKVFVALGFCTFLWFTLEYIGVGVVTPDLCVAAVVFLAAGICCRLSRPGSSGKHYVALGLALGLGYYAKAAMFPLGLLFLGGHLLYPPSPGALRQRQRLLLSLSFFLLMAAPLVTALSSRVGRLTFGETGRLNYAWYVNGLQPQVGWTGSDIGQSFSSIEEIGLLPYAASTSDSPHIYGTPEHPPRRLMETPVILEFGSPIKGTFPLWYDPSYWYAGARERFNLRQQIIALRYTLPVYEKVFTDAIVFFSGAVALCVLIAREKRLFHLLRRDSWLLTWPLTAMLMYALVHAETRFVGAFFVLLWLAIYGALIARVNRQVAVVVCATVIGTMMIPFMFQMVKTSARTVKDLVRSAQPDYETVALALSNLGLQSGDSLAVVGYPLSPYYAHYARLRVVAAVPATDEFWDLSAPGLESVAERLRQIGVKALVAKNRPPNSTLANWRDVKVSDSESFSILLLSEPLAKGPPR